MSVVVYGSDYCPFCKKVSKFLTEKNVKFNYIDTETEEGHEARDKLSKKYNWKTIPMVFINDEFVGGCDDFFKKLNNKQIQLPGL